MKRKIVLILGLSLLLSGCGKAELLGTNTEGDKKYLDQEVVAENPHIGNSDTAADYYTEDASFSIFAGNYYFSSGAGGWGTEVTLNEDGTFTGDFHDSDMGDFGEGYPGGTVYTCKFTGNFSELTKVDDFTYTATIEALDYDKDVNTEEIIDEIRYVKAEPYGFDNADVFEFYLPGKPIKELSEEFLSWSEVRYAAISPLVLPIKSFYNVGGEQGFNGEQERGTNTQTLPQSELITDLTRLAGMYENEKGDTISVSIYTDYTGGEEIGTAHVAIQKNDWVDEMDGRFLSLTNGYGFEPEYYSQVYPVIVTDNATNNVEINIYTPEGYDCGTYRMTEHYES